jgi:hypothetical protein
MVNITRKLLEDEGVIPKDIEAKSKADHVALCYTYDFLNQMHSVFSDWPNITPVDPETKEFIHQVERSFSRMSVYVYQLLCRARQYEGMTLPEIEKWPDTDLVNISSNESYKDDYEVELNPWPCWLGEKWLKKYGYSRKVEV